MIGKYIKPDMKREVISQFQTADQIIAQLRRAEFNSREFCKKVAPFFKKKTQLETAAYLHEWLRKNMPYQREPVEDQTARTIPRFFYDNLRKDKSKKSHGDCKHYATTCVGILNACGIPAWFSLAGQDKTKKKPNHAYCTAYIDGKLVTVDACKKVFGSECRHFYKWNYAPIKK